MLAISGVIGIVIGNDNTRPKGRKGKNREKQPKKQQGRPRGREICGGLRVPSPRYLRRIGRRYRPFLRIIPRVAGGFRRDFFRVRCVENVEKTTKTNKESE